MYWIAPLWVGFIAVYALIAVYAERKISAFIQDRMGPVEVGYKGLLQTFADILKLLQKETIVPAAADRLLFRAAPIAVFASVFAGFAVMPLAPGAVAAPVSAGVLFLIGIVSADAIGLLMTGWGSNNKYSLTGAVRAVAQIVSYEVPAGLALLAGIMMYGSPDLSEISRQQGLYDSRPQYLFGLWNVNELGGILSWGVIRYPHLLGVWVIFFIASLAEANRAPFDMPEAESELIGGFHTEYSGFGFAVLFLAEYAAMLLLSMVGVAVFWGSYHTPFPNLLTGVTPEAGFIENLTHLQFARLTSGTAGTVSGVLWGFFWLLAKSLILVGVMMWIRWTVPRLRSDQLLRLCWKYLTPAAMAAILISAVWKIAEVYAHI